MGAVHDLLSQRSCPGQFGARVSESRKSRRGHVAIETVFIVD